MMMHGGSGTWGGSTLMTVALVMFGALLITTVILTVRYLASSTRAPAAAATGLSRAERLLAQRYSRGDIDDEQYRQKLALLHRHH